MVSRLTTRCITGAMIGTSLGSGTVKSTNWRAIAWIYCGWIATIVVVTILRASSWVIIANAPRVLTSVCVSFTSCMLALPKSDLLMGRLLLGF
jgi:hypothetical protein